MNNFAAVSNTFSRDELVISFKHAKNTAILKFKQSLQE